MAITNQQGSPRAALHNPTSIMKFFEILDKFGTVMAWVVILLILWIVGPIILKIL